MNRPLDIVIFGLSITSSWGNGHATNYRALVKAMVARGHRVLFLERDVPWYSAARDLEVVDGAEVELYGDLEEVRAVFGARVQQADLVVLGSFVPAGRAVARWVLDSARGCTAFYDIDTPVTLARLASGNDDYLGPEQVPEFDLYLSFAGGPVLETLRRRHGARRARAFYCCVDESLHRPVSRAVEWELGYLGTYSDDRQPGLERLLLVPARMRPDTRFAVGGSGYPDGVEWPSNVQRVEHVPPPAHAAFYCGQRFTLNLTRRDMVAAGWSPSVRIFEAAACGVPAISDDWPGLGDLFSIGDEILVASSTADVLALLESTSQRRREEIAERVREKVLTHHTATRRVEELESHVEDVVTSRRTAAAGGAS